MKTCKTENLTEHIQIILIYWKSHNTFYKCIWKSLSQSFRRYWNFSNFTMCQHTNKKNEKKIFLLWREAVLRFEIAITECFLACSF